MSTAPKLTWLHVSDLHFGHGDAHYRFDQQGVTGAILRDAEERAKVLGPPDLIFVTGDIAFSGQKEQYAQAKDWLTKLLAKVGGSPRLFVVPGNHDVDRKQAAKVAAAALHRELRGDPKKLDELLQDDSQMQALWPKLGAYAEFAKDLGTPALTAESPFYSQEVECQLGGKVVVVGLNTALLCLDDQDGPKTLGLGRGQILKAIEQQPTDALLLVLQHHPPEWLSDGKDLAAYLQQRLHIQFSGHVHQQQGVVHMPLLGGRRLQFVAGAGHMDQKEDGSHAYAWGQLSEEGLAYHSLVWLPERKGFAPATILDSDDFKRGDHAFVERARLPKKLADWLPKKIPKPARKPPASKKAKPAALPPSVPPVPDSTSAVVPSQVLPPQASTVMAQVAESSANPSQASAEQRLRAKIAKALKDKDGSVLLVVGAGVSMGATLGGQHAKSASWDGLLELGITRCKSHGPNARATKALQAALTERSVTSVIKAATVVERSLIAKADWKSWLHEMFSQLVPTQHAVLEALCALGLPLVTANYDGLLEYVGRRQAVTWRDHAMVEQLLRGELAGILHLHGHFAEPESVVFGADSYKRVMDDGHTQAILRKLFLDKTLVFIGFGDGLHDPNFDALLHWASKSVLGSDVFHVRLALEKELPRLLMLHTTGQRLTPISYGKKHEDLAPFIRSLASSNPSPGGSGGGQPAAASTAHPATVVVDGLVAAPTTAATDAAKPLPSAGPQSLPALDKLKNDVRKFLQDVPALTKALAERGCGNPAQARAKLVEGVLDGILKRSAQDVAELLADLADSDELRDSARDLLWHILPLAGGWEDVFDHAEKAGASGGALELPLRTTTLAEIVMARSDARKVQFSLEHEEPQGVLHIPLPATAYAPLFDADGSKLAHAVLFNLYQDQPPDGLLPDAKHWRRVKMSFPNTAEFMTKVTSEINYLGSRQHRYLLFIDGLLEPDQNDLDAAWNVTQKAIQKTLPGLRLVRLKGKLTENPRESDLLNPIDKIRKLS